MAVPEVQGQVTVRVKLFADLRRFLPKGAEEPLSFTLPEGSTAGDLLAKIGISGEEIVTIAIQETLAHRDSVLSNGDEVLLFSPMEGGSPDAPGTQARGAPRA